MKKTLWVILLLHIGLIGLSQSVRQAKMCKDCWNKRSAAIEVPDKRANSMWELNRMGGVGKNKRTADYTNYPDVFRPLPENKDKNEVIIDAKRSAEAKNEEKRANSMWELNRMGGSGKNKRAADYTNFPDPFRPLPENKVEEDNIKEVKNEEKRADSMCDFNRMGAIGKNKRAADYTNFPDVFRPLHENKVEEDSIKEVKRDSGEKRSAQGQFHRAVVFKPSGKRTDECATNSPHVEINDTDLLEKCCRSWFPNPYLTERSGRVKDVIVFRACREHLLGPDKL